MCLLRGVITLCVLTIVVTSYGVLGGVATLNLANIRKEPHRPIKHLYMDFDHTITVDGFSGDIRNIFCKQEKYPKCNCDRLPGKLCNGTDAVSASEMVTSLETLEDGGRTALIKSFGGEERLNHFRDWLNHVRNELKGNVFIVSTSWFPVTGLQWRLYLKKVSDELDLGFDMEHIGTLADPGPGLSADKGGMIKKNMKEQGIEFDEAVFADDSSGNIKSALSVCQTVYLPKKKGLQQIDLDYIEWLIHGPEEATKEEGNEEEKEKEEEKEEEEEHEEEEHEEEEENKGIVTERVEVEVVKPAGSRDVFKSLRKIIEEIKELYHH